MKTLGHQEEKPIAAERRRLATLRSYKILDTPSERSFDDLALLAAHICETPVALVSLVDADRQWFKARVGLDAESTPRSVSFCAHAILGQDLLAIPDASKDPRFRSNPFVTGAPDIRFYAGAPLITSGGEALGTLCVIDRTPRTLRPDQADALRALARQVVSQLELRRTAAANAALCVKAKRASRRRAQLAVVAERLENEQRGLREAAAGMEQVLGVVGHELRTPIAALRAICEFLRTDGAGDTEQAEVFLQEFSQEVDRMSDTVNNLLEAARLNSGRARWNWADLDLTTIVEEAIDSIRPLVNSKRVRLHGRVDAAPTKVRGDRDAIRRLLLNLLSNARKHTSQGEIEVGGRFELDADGWWVELSVRDTGCGIPPAIVARLGEAFALNSGVVGSEHVSGTGLGLAICKGIVVAHGGGLGVDSAEGGGTTITARLRVDLHAAAHGDTHHEASAEEQTS